MAKGRHRGWGITGIVLIIAGHLPTMSWGQCPPGDCSPAAPACSAGGATCPSAGGSSEAASPAQPRKLYLHGSKFELPVVIADDQRARLQALRLYVRTGTGNWQLQETAPPTQKSFFFVPPADGVYGLSVATVDREGHLNPPDLFQQPPMLVLVVDRQPPQIEVQPVQGLDGSWLLRCQIQDANPDYNSIQVSYKGADQQWHALEPLAGMPGLFRLPSRDLWPCTFRVRAQDLARNSATREMRLDASGQLLPPEGASPASGPVVTAACPPIPGQAPLPAGNSLQVAGPPESGQVVPATTRDPAPATAPSASRPAVLPGEAPPLEMPEPAPATARPSLTMTSNPLGGQRQLVNSTQVSLEYQLGHLGPSGVGKVTVYCTRDEGRTWQRLGEDPDRRSPVELTLPGEGVFGLRLVATNGNGFGGKAPAPGDPPHCWVEVDLTPPQARLHDIEPVLHDGALEIRWTAHDKNLGATPVNLYYATHKGEKWLPIARHLRNEGFYRWLLPQDIGGRFYLRLEVVDRAGNVTHCDSETPVVLDLSEPQITVVGITPLPRR